MAILTIIANPATADGNFLSIMVTKTVYRERIEVKKAAEAQAAFEAAIAKAQAAIPAGGYQICAFIFDNDGRKPNGFNKLKLNKFIEKKEIA